MPAASERLTEMYWGQQVRNPALLLVTGVAIYLCWLLARPFLAGITWALALVVAGYPLHRWFERRLGSNAAAVCSLLAILAPGALLVQKALDETSGGLGTIGQNLSFERLMETAERYPLSARVAAEPPLWLQPGCRPIWATSRAC